MLITLLKKVAALAFAAITATGCATQMDLKKNSDIPQGPSVREIVSRYQAAEKCIAEIPETKGLRIAIENVPEVTGRINMAEGGMGQFMPVNINQMLTTSLHNMGATVVDMSVEQRSAVEWFQQMGAMPRWNYETTAKAEKPLPFSNSKPDFIIRGSISSLDFGHNSSVKELVVAGIGPKERAYTALASSDFSVKTFPSLQHPGGIVIATSGLVQEFTGYEHELGASSFVGSEIKNANFMSVRVGESRRVPMQFAVREMGQYAIGDAITKILLRTQADKAKVAACRVLLQKTQE